MARRFFIWSHRWFGLVVGFYFVLLGLSGSYLVYPDQFDFWFFPEMRQSQVLPSVEATQLGKFDLQKMVQVAQEGMQTTLEPTRLKIFDPAVRNLEMGFTGLPGQGRGIVTAFVDPQTQEFKGQENFRQTLRGFLFIFHHDLFLGALGHTIVGMAGLLMLFLLLSGLYLWWPKSGNWRAVLTLKQVRTFLQIHLELHRLTGFYTLLLMIVVTFSGVYIAKPDWFQKRRASYKPVISNPLSEDEPLDFQALGKKLSTLGKEPLQVRINRKNSTISVLKILDGTRQQLHARTFEEIFEPDTKPLNMRATQHDLHVGNFWGALGKFLIFLSGLLPLFFYITGTYIWWKKSRRFL